MSLVGSESAPHHDLRRLHSRLHSIHDAILCFNPLTAKPPIIDSSAEESGGESNWLQQENVPGMRKLREAVKRDLDVLEKFLADSECASSPPLSTNAPYLIAVWNEILCAPPPIVQVFKTVCPTPSTSTSTQQRGGHKSTGVKIDVVAENGRRWIRVNTIKNARLLAEFREIDSYLTSSEDDAEDPSQPPTLAQAEFDNSVLRMGRALINAAKGNPVDGSEEISRVALRLTRLDPSVPNADGAESDLRIARTIQCLKDMGVDVMLGERDPEDLVAKAVDPVPPTTLPPIPSRRINLDLSVLVALVSDITHAPLPISTDEANARFNPSQTYLDWKKQRVTQSRTQKHKGDSSSSYTNEDAEVDVAQHSRALSNQLIQEMEKGLIQEIHDKLLTSASNSGESIRESRLGVEFWATPEARDRFLRIVSKIGGPDEKRRAHALFPSESHSLQLCEEAYWSTSRYSMCFIPLLPIALYPASEPSESVALPSEIEPPQTLPTFFNSLTRTCIDIFKYAACPHPRGVEDDPIKDTDSKDAPDASTGGEFQRTVITKANLRVTAHTVQTMFWGARLGWTTLTANKSSVKAILRELKAAKVAGRLDSGSAETSHGHILHDRETAAIWIVDPRSLAEGMRSDYVT